MKRLSFRLAAKSLTLVTGLISLSLAVGCESVGDIGGQAGGNPSPPGSVGTGGNSGLNGGGGGSGGSSAPATGLPCDVQAVFSAHCTSCHGVTPLGGAPMSLVTIAQLTAPSAVDPSQTNAQRAVARMQSTTTPMPPTPPAVSAAEVTTVQSWIAAGYPTGSCGVTTMTGTGGASGAGGATGAGGAGGAPDPFSVAPTCTSRTDGTSNGSPVMDPGRACISCHTSSGGEAPRFGIAGTVYPTGHEPDNCNGANSGGISVQITQANGQVISLTANQAGNFSYGGSVSLPYTAQVTYMGRTRGMATPQTTGDCNSCHTQNGSNGAPGRILLP